MYVYVHIYICITEMHKDMKDNIYAESLEPDSNVRNRPPIMQGRNVKTRERSNVWHGTERNRTQCNGTERNGTGPMSRPGGRKPRLWDPKPWNGDPTPMRGDPKPRLGHPSLYLGIPSLGAGTLSLYSGTSSLGLGTQA